ncbi:unnamed protein product [Rhizophagus irregularis]|nr:unnamed protein product [Rhizophagus irregularis]CAB4411287.1 unnamed protein product [Rhizophagus irregularis]
MQLSKLIFPAALIIFNHVILTNCGLFGGSDLYSFFSGDKLYFFRSIKYNFFYVDLAGVSLDTDTVIDKSKWIDLTEVKPQPDTSAREPLLDKANENLILLDYTDDGVDAYTFHITLNTWETKPFKVKNKVSIGIGVWVSDEKTGISYLFDKIDNDMTILDSINLTLTKSISTADNLFVEGFVMDNFVQVLSNGQILFIGGGSGSIKYSMNNILMYDTLTDTWQMMNATGETPEGRLGHTAVSISDGRIIVFGGISNSLPASPQLSILDTSKTPYEWSTPTVENPFGPFTFSGHIAVMVKDYMIIAFGINTTETIPSLIDNKNIYKLDTRDPLKYKWSFLSGFDDKSDFSNSSLNIYKPTNSTPIQASVDSAFRLGTRNIVIIVFAMIVFICISIFVFYKAKQYRSKNTNQRNISSSENISSNDELKA